MKNEPLDDARNVLLIDAAFQMPISNRPHMLHSTNVRGRGEKAIMIDSSPSVGPQLEITFHFHYSHFH